MQNIHHSLSHFFPFFQKLSVLFFPVYVISSCQLESKCVHFARRNEWGLLLPEPCVWLWNWKRMPFVCVCSCIYVCVLWVNLRCACTRARMHMPASRSLSACLIAAQNFTWHQSACKEIVISLQASCSWLKPAVATGLSLSACLSLSSPPFLVFFPFSFSSRPNSPWHK